VDSKVLLIGWGYPPKIDGGLDIHVKHLFEELQKRGNVEVDLALPEERAPERENIIGIDTGKGGMVEKARKMSQEITKLSEDYDIIHTHDWFGAEAGFKAQKYSDVKWVATFHSLSSSRNREPSPELRKMEKAAAENADELITVSKKLQEELESEFQADSEVVYNGFSKPQSSGIDVKDELGIDNEMVFYVGRHAEQKGLEYLLYGFQKLLKDRDATLVLGGEGHMTESLEEFTEILGIKESVVFTGFIPREELGDYYREADVFVSPSINEPFGLTITEALESGTSVVATENGVEEIAGNSIISVESHSDSLKEGIKKALQMDQVPEFENRSWKEMAEETLELY